MFLTSVGTPTITAFATFQPNARLSQSIEWQRVDFNRADTRADVYDLVIVNSRTTYQFSRRLYARIIAQHDTSSHRLLLDALGSYELRPGTVFFAGYGALRERRAYDAGDWRTDELSPLRDLLQRAFGVNARQMQAVFRGRMNILERIYTFCGLFGGLCNGLSGRDLAAQRLLRGASPERAAGHACDADANILYRVVSAQRHLRRHPGQGEPGSRLRDFEIDAARARRGHRHPDLR